MDKEAADRIITEYVPKIYGFALSKTRDTGEAEELASDITYEVYLSLLREGEIFHVNRYIWRISSFVFAHWAAKKSRMRAQGGISVDEVMESVATDGMRMPEALIDREEEERAERAEHADSLRRLRREIAYLGELQRQIIVAHYYGGQPVQTIAKAMNLPVGTVKWHLYDARQTIKEGMNMERTKGTLGISPIRFASMGHSGYAGPTGDTAAHLNTVLAQNIAYAAYRTPKTEEEIAEELGITPVFLADIVAHLEEYGFMSRVEGNRLRTDIIIEQSTKESDEAIHALKVETAARLCETFMPAWVANMDGYYEAHKDDIYLPDRDRNLWLWSAFMMGQNAFDGQNAAKIDEETMKQYRIKRPDGGEFTAHASIEDDYSVSYDGSLYWACGYMTRESYRYNGLFALQMSTTCDSRPKGWQDNTTEDYETLYECYTGKLPETQPNAYKYQRLFDRGLVVRREGEISVNVPVLRQGMEPFDLFRGVDMEAVHAMYTAYAEKLLSIQLDLYPAHVQDYIRACSKAGTYTGSLYMYFYRWMLDNGILTLPEDDRRGGIMTVVWADTLPQN